MPIASGEVTRCKLVLPAVYQDALTTRGRDETGVALADIEEREGQRRPVRGLELAFDPSDPTVVCYRGSRVEYTAEGKLASYRTWRNATDKKSEQPSTDLLPVNQAGVLYPPGSLLPEANDYSLIQMLSPTSDEAWLFFMWRFAGWRVRRVPGKFPAFAEWPGSQEEALWKMHRGGRKDEHFQTLAKHYGIP